MNRRILRTATLLVALCLSLLLCACAGKDKDSSKDDRTVIDYGDEAAFEAMMNAGKDMVGKVVRFTAKELHPDSPLGYNIWAGRHLNFISSGDPGIAQGETVVVKILSVDNALGSWLMTYERLGDEDVVDGKKTLTSDTPGLGLPDSYKENEYFELIGEAELHSSYSGGTMVVHKVRAKKDCAVCGTLKANSYQLGFEVETSEDTVYLTKGEEDAFIFWFDEDISDCLFKGEVEEAVDHILMGDRSAMKMLSWDRTSEGAELLIKQTANITNMSYIKVLFIRDGRIVAVDGGFISYFSSAFVGKGSEGTVNVDAGGEDFDDIEFIYEP